VEGIPAKNVGPASQISEHLRLSIHIKDNNSIQPALPTRPTRLLSAHLRPQPAVFVSNYY
jgi:hypothetical protein